MLRSREIIADPNPEDYYPLAGEGCFFFRYRSEDSTADMDGLAISVASESWSHRGRLSLGC
jgi:hypothetical protein